MRSILCIPLLLASIYAAPLITKRSDDIPSKSPRRLPPKQDLPRHIGRLAGSRIEQRERITLNHPDSRAPEEIYNRAWTDLHIPSEEERRSWSEGEYIGDLLQTEDDREAEAETEAGLELDLEDIQPGGGDTDEEMAYWAQWAHEVAEGQYELDPSEIGDEGERIVWWFDEETGGWVYDTYNSVMNEETSTDIPEIILSDDAVQLRLGATITPPTGGWDVDEKGEWYLVHLE